MPENRQGGVLEHIHFFGLTWRGIDWLGFLVFFFPRNWSFGRDLSHFWVQICHFFTILSSKQYFQNLGLGILLKADQNVNNWGLNSEYSGLSSWNMSAVVPGWFLLRSAASREGENVLKENKQVLSVPYPISIRAQRDSLHFHWSQFCPGVCCFKGFPYLHKDLSHSSHFGVGGDAL